MRPEHKVRQNARKILWKRRGGAWLAGNFQRKRTGRPAKPLRPTHTPDTDLRRTCAFVSLFVQFSWSEERGGGGGGHLCDRKTQRGQGGVDMHRLVRRRILRRGVLTVDNLKK